MLGLAALLVLGSAAREFLSVSRPEKVIDGSFTAIFSSGNYGLYVERREGSREVVYEVTSGNALSYRSEVDASDDACGVSSDGSLVVVPRWQQGYALARGERVRTSDVFGRIYGLAVRGSFSACMTRDLKLLWWDGRSFLGSVQMPSALGQYGLSARSARLAQVSLIRGRPTLRLVLARAGMIDTIDRVLKGIGDCKVYFPGEMLEFLDDDHVATLLTLMRKGRADLRAVIISLQTGEVQTLAPIEGLARSLESSSKEPVYIRSASPDPDSRWLTTVGASQIWEIGRGGIYRYSIVTTASKRKQEAFWDDSNYFGAKQ